MFCYWSSAMPERSGVLSRVAAMVAIVAVTAAAVGCNQSGAPTGSVHGRISFNDESIGEAQVMFENGDIGSVAAVPLSADGSYKIEELRTGEYVVTVIPPNTHVSKEIGDFDGSETVRQSRLTAPKKFPTKFSSGQTSPLRHTIVEGDSEFSVNLADQ